MKTNSQSKTLFLNPWTLALPLLDLPEARRSLSTAAISQIRTLSLPNAYYNIQTKKLQLEKIDYDLGKPIEQLLSRYAIFTLLECLQIDNSRLRQMEAILWLKTYTDLPEIASIIRTTSFNNFLKTGEVLYEK